ncbi:hypothetical protein [Paenibacillus xylanilyticus]|nr:hypothetical protein [Paenibacillus xylanilyticus]
MKRKTMVLLATLCLFASFAASASAASVDNGYSLLSDRQTGTVK